MNADSKTRWRLGESTSAEKTPDDGEAQKCVYSRAQNSSFLKLKNLVAVQMVQACQLGGFIIFVGGLVGAGTFCVAIGILHMHQCPLQEHLPIYLTAEGVLMLFTLPYVVISSGRRPMATRSSTELLHLVYKVSLCSVDIVLLVYGTVVVNAATPPNYDPVKGPHCSRICFLASFFLVTATWLFIVLLVLFAALLMCGYVICQGASKIDLSSSPA